MQGTLSEPLPNLLCAEATDSIQPKTKYDTVLLPNPNVESVILCGDGAAIPTVSNGGGRTDKGTISLPGSGLKVEEE